MPTRKRESGEEPRSSAPGRQASRATSSARQDPAPRHSRAGPRLPRTARLTDIDARDVTGLLRITFWFAPACILILSFVWYNLWSDGAISGAQFGILLVVDFPLAGIGVLLINSLAGRFDTGRVGTIAGDVTAARTYVRQEMHIARGEYRAAAEYFRDHLVVEPDDNQARLRLAHLLEARLADDAGAEALYKEVQSRQPSPREETAATNGLIDLYRRTGRRDRLMVELARFAERHRDSTAGEAARRELSELKRDSVPPES